MGHFSQIDIFEALESLQVEWGVNTGGFAGMTGAEVEKQLTLDEGPTYIEFHLDWLATLPAFRSYIKGASYHTNYSRGEQAELKTIDAAIEFGCTRIIVHPNLIENYSTLKRYGSLICLENLDFRYPGCRTLANIEAFLQLLPDASVCLDLGHTADNTKLASDIWNNLKPKINQIHFSQICLLTGEHQGSVDRWFLNRCKDILIEASYLGIPIIAEPETNKKFHRPKFTCLSHSKSAIMSNTYEPTHFSVQCI